MTYLQIVEEDSFEDYIPEEDLALEEQFLHPPTAEKETNTECNFCPEGARQLHNRYESQSTIIIIIDNTYVVDL